MTGDGSHTMYFQLRETFERDRHGSLPDAYGFCSMAKSKSFEFKKKHKLNHFLKEVFLAQNCLKLFIFALVVQAMGTATFY